MNPINSVSSWGDDGNFTLMRSKVTVEHYNFFSGFSFIFVHACWYLFTVHAQSVPELSLAAPNYPNMNPT